MTNDNPWELGTYVHTEIAALLRGILRHRTAMETTYRWTPFPQNYCPFTFGADEQPLPVGALLRLWDDCSEFSTQCPECGGRVLGYSWVSLFTIGDVWGACTQCGRAFGKSHRGMVAIVRIVKPVLKETEFFLSTSRLGGAHVGQRLPLYAALVELGETDLPSPEWALEGSTSSVSFSIGDQPAHIELTDAGAEICLHDEGSSSDRTRGAPNSRPSRRSASPGGIARARRPRARGLPRRPK